MIVTLDPGKAPQLFGLWSTACECSCGDWRRFVTLRTWPPGREGLTLGRFNYVNDALKPLDNSASRA